MKLCQRTGQVASLTVMCVSLMLTSRAAVAQGPIPEGSTVASTQQNTWAIYRRYIIVGSALLATQTALIGALLFYQRRRRRAEQALRESEERFRLLADTAPVLIWKGGTDKLADYFNRPWLAFRGRSLEQELGDGWSGGVWPEDLERVRHTYDTAFDARQPFRVEYRLRAADGAYRWVLGSGVPRFGPDGAFAGYIGTCVDVTEQRDAQDALRASALEIQQLAGRLVEAQDAERARVARDLHDDVSQQLAGLAISLSGLKRRLGPSVSEGDPSSDVELLQQRTIALANNVRDLSHDLHPDVLRHIGLVAALDTHCAELRRRHRAALTFDARGDLDSIDQAKAVCLYRVAQEALRNVVTHAQASHTDVRLVRDGEEVELLVADNGRGFDVGSAHASSKGLGLVSLHERVRLAGGTVSLLTELNKGTRVRVRIPLVTPSVTPHREGPARYATAN